MTLLSSIVCTIIGSDSGPGPTSLNACTIKLYLVNFSKLDNIISPIPSSISPDMEVKL